MLLFRSLTLGLVAACFALLLARPTVELRVVHEAAPHLSAPRARPPLATVAPTVIDVAAGVTSVQLASMIRLLPGEHVATIDDAEMPDELDAGVALASVALQPRRFIDVGVVGPVGERRVLVLLH